MSSRTLSQAAAAALLVASLPTPATMVARQQAPAIAASAARISIEGSSNIHPYTASTTALVVKGASLTIDAANPDLLAEIVKPGALQGFEISVPAASLASGKDGLDKNMHKALKVQSHPNIAFRLQRLQPGAAGAVRALGVLAIAGVEREVAFDVTWQLNASVIAVKGSVPLLMTDYGIAPPKAMLGMLKTDPKVTVTFEASFTIPPAQVAGNS
jgi:polyisoprenoid-binding protein YceI